MKAQLTALILGTAVCATVMGLPSFARAGDESETAELLIALLKSGRAVVSEHQALINDPICALVQRA